jgi:sugar/nucleoside kinase (ribokinase family)|tara:strand:- start:1053 stop:1925 length:873 start_codon:yes stop_codon:yes gene_type:complete
MKIGIYSHCTIDTIIHGDNMYEVPGGPACYCSLTARKQKFDVNLSTKYGPDFPLTDSLLENKIRIEDKLSTSDTTRFKIILNDSDRKLFIQNKCEPLEFLDENNNGIIISPVFDEITNELFKKIKKSSDFILLDPQGFLRRHNSENLIILKETKLDLDGISAIKVSPNELFALTGANDDAALLSLQKLGVENVIFTNKQNISLLVKDKIYSIQLPNLELFDTTGVGDIFCATFCCTMLREKDFLWALSFAGGAAQAALETKKIGINKIPEKGAVENNGSYFYNMVQFRQI